MTSRAAFKLTERQIRDLHAITPKGRVPQITISFPREEERVNVPEKEEEDTCEGAFGRS